MPAAVRTYKRTPLHTSCLNAIRRPFLALHSLRPFPRRRESHRRKNFAKIFFGFGHFFCYSVKKYIFSHSRSPAMPSPGQPKALDPDKQQTVCSLIGAGVSLRQAAHFVHCDPKTIRSEAKRNEEF